MSKDLQEIADGVLTAVDAERCAVVLSEDDGDTVNFIAASGPGTEEMVGNKGPAEGSGLCGSVLGGSCPVLAVETLGDERIHQGHTVEMGIDTALGVPVYHDGEAFAVLMALNKADRSKFSEADEAKLVDYAATIADDLWASVGAAR
jgi:signal transduction protein with GAF and PtsI domain